MLSGYMNKLSVLQLLMTTAFMYLILKIQKQILSFCYILWKQLLVFPYGQQSYVQHQGALLCSAVKENHFYPAGKDLGVLAGSKKDAEPLQSGRSAPSCRLTVVLSRTTSQSLSVVLLHVAFTRH